MRSLAARDLALHGFGVKTAGLARYQNALASTDSMAWSFRGRHVPGCTSTHRSESNCLSFALRWRNNLLTKLTAGQPPAVDRVAPSAARAAA
jgi:hypothetical protein